MNKLNQETQAYLLNMPVEEEALSAGEKGAIYHLVMNKINLDHSEAVPNVVALERPRRRVKPAFLIAAVVATIGLLGAGYAANTYFDKLYTLTDDPAFEEYDLVRDDPHLLVEPPAFVNEDAAAESGVSIVKIEEYRYRFLEDVFLGRKPGEWFDVEIHAPDNKWSGTGLTGNALSLLYTVSEQGIPGEDLLINRDQAPSTQKVIDKLIADGEFLVTIDHPDYTPIEVDNLDYIKSIVYQDKEGSTINLRTIHVVERSMSKDAVDLSATTEMEINGNQFVLIARTDDSYLLHMYLGEYEEGHFSESAIYYQRGTRDQYLAVANNIKVHNKHANNISTPSREFFANFPLPDVQAGAADIVAGIEAYRQGGDVVHQAQTIWEKDGLEVGVYDVGGRRVSISMAKGFEGNAALYPFGKHTVLTEQSWFPKDRLDRLVTVYEGETPLYATYSQSGSNAFFHSAISGNGYLKSPLDAILYKMSEDGQLELENVINPTSANPIVVAIGREVAWIYSAVRLEDGRYLTEVLYLPEKDLPGELRGS